MAELMRRIDDRRQELVAKAMGLIKEDAPKNKFSVVTGKLKMVELIKSRILTLESEPAKSQG